MATPHTTEIIDPTIEAAQQQLQTARMQVGALTLAGFRELAESVKITEVAIGPAKAVLGMDIHDPAQEEVVIAGLQEAMAGKLTSEEVESLARPLIAIRRAVQERGRADVPKESGTVQAASITATSLEVV